MGIGGKVGFLFEIGMEWFSPRKEEAYSGSDATSAKVRNNRCFFMTGGGRNNISDYGRLIANKQSCAKVTRIVDPRIMCLVCNNDKIRMRKNARTLSGKLCSSFSPCSTSFRIIVKQRWIESARIEIDGLPPRAGNLFSGYQVIS